MKFATNMSETLNQGGLTNLARRLRLFVRARTNKSVFVHDKEMEDVNNVAVPLGSLPELQAQSQEHMAAAVGIPLIMYFSITPTGLNASSDSEIKVFNGWIHSLQEFFYRPNIQSMHEYIQVSELGVDKPDPDITFEFLPLAVKDTKDIVSEFSEKAKSFEILKNVGAVSPKEIRGALVQEEDGPFEGLNPEEVPEDPAVMEMESEEAALAQAYANGGEPLGTNGAAPPKPGGAEPSSPVLKALGAKAAPVAEPAPKANGALLSKSKERMQ
jgi:hypothetical protein